MTTPSRTTKSGEPTNRFGASGQSVLSSSVGQLLDIDSVARSLGGSSRYVRRLVAERRNAYVKVGHLVRLESVDVSRWIDDSRVDAMRPAPGERGPGNGTGRSRGDPRCRPRLPAPCLGVSRGDRGIQCATMRQTIEKHLVTGCALGDSNAPRPSCRAVACARRRSDRVLRAFGFNLRRSSNLVVRWPPFVGLAARGRIGFGTEGASDLEFPRPLRVGGCRPRERIRVGFDSSSCVRRSRCVAERCVEVDRSRSVCVRS